MANLDIRVVHGPDGTPCGNQGDPLESQGLPKCDYRVNTGLKCYIVVRFVVWQKIRHFCTIIWKFEKENKVPALQG